MSRRLQAAAGLGVLMILMAARPAAAQDPAQQFQETVQSALSTLDQMQALFVRIDQRHQAAAAASAAARTDQSR